MPSNILKHREARIFLLLALIVVGIIPILLSLMWINGNMTLPGEVHRLFQEKLGWPWLGFEESSTTLRTLVDLLLSLGVFFLAALVSRTFRWRTLTVIALGVGLFCAMSCWQYTGIAIWSVRAPMFSADILYTVLLAWALWTGLRDLNFYVLLGFSQIYPLENEVFENLMPQSRSLLPLALCFFVTPFMSLDRLLFSIVSLGFLTISFKFSRLAKANRPC